MIIHSHRGLDFGPENTLAAFRDALQAGCGLELDVRLTKDNDIAIIHDPIKNNTEPVPTFDELAALLKKFSLPPDAVAVHLKLAEQTEPMMARLVDKIAEHELENAVFIFDIARPAIDFLKARHPKLRLAISLGADHHAPTIFTLKDLPQFSDVPIIWWDEWGQAAGQLYSEANLRPLQERNLKVYVVSPDVAYQTNHPMAYDGKYRPVWSDLIQWEVDGICTDQSQELLNFISSGKPPP